MTRINADISPKKLTDQHLLAEYREIGRVSTQYQKRWLLKKGYDDIPKEFTLGSGHQSFFLNKGKFLHKRFNSLTEEMKHRGFKPKLKFRNTWVFGGKHYNDWQSSEKDNKLIIERISERVKAQAKPIRYYSKIIDVKFYIKNILTK